MTKQFNSENDMRKEICDNAKGNARELNTCYSQDDFLKDVVETISVRLDISKRDISRSIINESLLNGIISTDYFCAGFEALSLGDVEVDLVLAYDVGLSKLTAEIWFDTICDEEETQKVLEQYERTADDKILWWNNNEGTRVSFCREINCEQCDKIALGRLLDQVFEVMRSGEGFAKYVFPILALVDDDYCDDDADTDNKVKHDKRQINDIIVDPMESDRSMMYGDNEDVKEDIIKKAEKEAIKKIDFLAKNCELEKQIMSFVNVKRKDWFHSPHILLFKECMNALSKEDLSKEEKRYLKEITENMPQIQKLRNIIVCTKTNISEDLLNDAYSRVEKMLTMLNNDKVKIKRLLSK